jgi:hypothetical protein
MPHSLDLKKVRLKAQQAEEYKEVSYNETTRVVSFAKEEGAGTNDRVRIDVYWTKGTVGTCLHHPHRHGKTQLFRRCVSLDTLAQIFENPRIHSSTGAPGYHRVAFSSLQENERWRLFEDWGGTTTEESAQQANLEQRAEENDVTFFSLCWLFVLDTN